jgi:restriction system protein
MRKNHPLVALAGLPWQASVVCTVIVFIAVRWGGPAVAGTNPILVPMFAAFANHAHWVAAVFLIPLPFALLHAARRRRLAATLPQLDRINALSWQDFEALVAEVYRRKGYDVVERGGPSADGGVDLELRTNHKKLVVQCKRWKTRLVGVERVRELYGAMTAERATAAIMVSSGRYTPDALAFAQGKPIDLVDGAQLVVLLAGVQQAREPKAAGRSTTATNQPSLSPPVAASGTPATPPDAVSCPRGCSRFPSCRGTLPAD